MVIHGTNAFAQIRALEARFCRTFARAIPLFTSVAFALLVVMSCLLASSPAAAQTTAAPEQGWPGIVPGSNDYSDANLVAYDAPADACFSFENSFVPNFGYQVYSVISHTRIADAIDPDTGVPAPTYRCRMDGGPNGISDILVLYGCTKATVLLEGACTAPTTPASAEQNCNGPTRWVCPTVGDPVSVATGAKVETVTDYNSGGAVPITIERSYRSLLMPLSGIRDGLGLAWRLNLTGRRLQVVDRRSTVIIRREDGMQRRFSRTASSEFAPSEYVNYSIQQSSGSHWNDYTQLDRLFFRGDAVYAYEYEDEDGRIDRFETQDIGGRNYQLKKTTWRNGYWQAYTYETNLSLKVTGITDSLGRQLTFQWAGDLITSIGLPDGNRIEYRYTPIFDNGVAIPGSEVLTSVLRFDSNGQLIDSKAYEYDRTSPSTQVPLLTGMYDAKGIKVDSTTYDPTGRVLSAEGPGGTNKVTLTYDDSSESLYYRTVTDALGQSYKHTYIRDRTSFGGGRYSAYSAPRLVSLERIATATVPAAQKQFTQNRYNPGGVVDWNGNVTQITNDVIDSTTYRMAPIQKIEDVNGIARTSTMAYDAVTHDLLQIVTPKLTTKFSYDAAGRVTRREELDTSGRSPVSRAWDFTYNTLGQLLSATGPRTDVAQTTTYAYDARGYLSSVTNALGHTTTINALDAGGRPTSVTDANGVSTTMTYDPLGRVKTVTVNGPVPATTTFAYDVNGLLISAVSAEGVTLVYGYDEAHRLISISDSSGNAMVFQLDAAGNKLQTQVLTGANQVLLANRTVFDSLGRTLQNIGAANQTTSFGYDHNSNLTQVTDPRSAVTGSAFDGLNRVVRTIDALSGATDVAYDQNDNVTSMIDARRNATTYQVNGFGFVTEIISPDSGTSTFTHDLAGNILTSKDARRITTTYTYDALDRPLTRSYSSGTSENVTFSYDNPAAGIYGIGRLTSVVDQAGSETFAYDAYGNRVMRRRTINGIVHATECNYDLDGNVARIAYPGGMIVNYQRNLDGEVVQITMQANATAPATVIMTNGAYMPFGPAKAYMLGNGVQVTNAYDYDYRLTNVTARGLSTVQDLTVAYDPSGNIASITDAVNAGLSQTFNYNLLSRVTRAVGIYGEDNYTYDALGNRLSRSVVNGTTNTSTYTYGTGNNRLLSATVNSVGRTYTHDAAGARTQVSIGSGKTAQVTNYTYNGAQRLATVGSTSYRYNAFGERVLRVTASGNTRFVFDENGLLLGEYTGQGAVVRNFIYFNGAPIAMIDAAGVVHYILNDHLGQPQKMLNASGNVSWHRAAEVYGKTANQLVGAANDNPLRFPGQQADPFTNLNYNYFRTYDPDTGRYLETDPIGLDGGMNLYAYVEGNPVSRTDRSGLIPLDMALDIGFILNDLYKLGRDAFSDPYCPPKGRFRENLTALGLDVAGLLIPYATGLGSAYRAGRAAESDVIAPIHKNSLNYIGETHVYAIRGPDGSLFKVGESAQGVRLGDGASIRAEQQARALTRETGDIYTTEIRQIFGGKADARAYETKFIQTYVRLFGKRPPRNQLDR